MTKNWYSCYKFLNCQFSFQVSFFLNYVSDTSVLYLQENSASVLIQRENATQKSFNNSKSGLSTDEIPNQPAERPKLNLKPVAQLLEQPEVKTEKDR